MTNRPIKRTCGSVWLLLYIFHANVSPIRGFLLLPQPTFTPCRGFTATVLYDNESAEINSYNNDGPMILCDLQTLLKLTQVLPTGGATKVAIQAGECLLNGVVETRRSKKLFAGDLVTFRDTDYSVDDMVAQHQYQYRPKTKKTVSPSDTTADAEEKDDDEPEFQGSFRSPEWRAARLQKKLDRKLEKKREKKREDNQKRSMES